MPSKFGQYFPRVQNRPQQSDDVQRGMEIGSAFGKDIQSLGSTLAGAIQEERKNAIANQLMDEQSISEQPGAGQTISLGKLGGDGSGGGNGDGAGQTQDLGTVPADSTFTNPATGDVQPLEQDQGASDADLARAIAAARLQGSGPTVGSTPDLSQAIGAQRAASALGGGDFTLNPSDYTSGGFSGKGNVGGSFDAAAGPGTVGGLLHTGGVQEMDLRKAMVAQQLAKSKADADAADRAAEASGTGRYALDAATKRLQFAKLQAEVNKATQPEKPDKNAPAVNIGSEPVVDQKQLVDHFEGTYGKGSFADVMSNLDQVDTKTSPGFVIVGPPDKPVAKIPIADAQIMVKQQNALRIKQGLQPFRVPGEEADYEGNMVGATAGNPYIAKNNLDVYSRAPGTWVRLPNGKVAQVPGKQ